MKKIRIFLITMLLAIICAFPSYASRPTMSLSEYTDDSDLIFGSDDIVIIGPDESDTSYEIRYEEKKYDALDGDDLMPIAKFIIDNLGSIFNIVVAGGAGFIGVGIVCIPLLGRIFSIIKKVF